MEERQQSTELTQFINLLIFTRVETVKQSIKCLRLWWKYRTILILIHMDVNSKVITCLVRPDCAAMLPEELVFRNLLLCVATKPQAGKPCESCMTSNTYLVYYIQICQYLSTFNTRMTWSIILKIRFRYHHHRAIIKFEQVAHW